MKINTAAARSKLIPRREPYWQAIRKGGAIGYRKLDNGSGTWIARHTVNGRKVYKSLGDLAAFDDATRSDKAGALAREWFDGLGNMEAPAGRVTVEQACDYYIRHLRAEKGEDTAKNTEWRFKAHVIPKLGRKYLDELTKAGLNRWRNDLIPEGNAETIRRARVTTNRLLNVFKAALNLAREHDLVGNDVAWRGLRRFQKVQAPRKLLLTDKQIASLVEHSPPAFANLVKGLLLTGLRPGKEIERLLVEQLHEDGTLEVWESKTDLRTVHLSDEARAFLYEQARDKLPKAYLFPREDGGRWLPKEA